MPIITNTDLQHIGDKLARFAGESVGDPEFAAGFNAGMEKAANDVLSGSNSIAQYLLDLADEDVTADLLPAARDLDETHPSPADGFLLSLGGVGAMLKAMNTHFKRYGYAGLDAYLTSLNGATGLTPTLRFHGHFKKYLQTISAQNAFIPADLDLATFAVTGGAAGTYAHLAAISKAQYAGAKLVLKNVGALTTSPVVTVTGKRWATGATASLTATISVHTDLHETDLSDTGELWMDVTNITIASGGTSGDHFKVVAKSDRDVSAA